ncbi:hypothetical protein [Streptomyces scabiei]|uniref:hypothetical protein n=1 Tax=Streptomyces scabiei TaxID=1930 RepID=UPI0029A1B8B5|nr:hypothetical protein [Streptomyces scabiei]MDX3524722.1 hypothetical protein [Streptomyces scabiei]
MQLDDVDLGNRGITVGGHLRPFDDLTHRAVLDWLDHRRNRRPNTANPHLLITQKTAVDSARPAVSGPPGPPATSPPPSNGPAATGNSKKRSPAAPTRSISHWSSGIGEKTDDQHLAEGKQARYADSARALLGEPAEQASQ